MSAQEPTAGEIAARKREQMLRLGQALGLNEEFVRDVAARGQLAIIDRTMAVDKTGAHARLMALVQRIAIFVEENVIAGRQVPPEAMLDTIETMAEQLEINPAMGIEVVGPVLEVYQEATRFLSQQGEEDGDNKSTILPRPQPAA